MVVTLGYKNKIAFLNRIYLIVNEVSRFSLLQVIQLVPRVYVHLIHYIIFLLVQEFYKSHTFIPCVFSL